MKDDLLIMNTLGKRSLPRILPVMVLAAAAVTFAVIKNGSLSGWRYFDSPRRFTGTDYGTQKGWERVTDVNEHMSTNDDFKQFPSGEAAPF